MSLLHEASRNVWVKLTAPQMVLFQSQTILAGTLLCFYHLSAADLIQKVFRRRSIAKKYYRVLSPAEKKCVPDFGFDVDKLAS